MIRSAMFHATVLLLGSVVLVGCGSSTAAPKTAKAEGQVTHQGKPVTEGEIYFVAAEKGYSASATLGAEGKYQITSSLPPASYKVFITRPRITKAPMAGEAPPEVKEFLVPDKYQSDTTSGLTADIKSGDNTVNFPVD